MCHRCWVAAGRHNPAARLDANAELVAAPPPRVSIDLEGYRRAPNTANRCLFPACQNDNLQRIPNFLKTRVLVVSKIYLPQSARICEEHFLNGQWEELDGLQLHTFTAEQLQDMLNTLIQAYNEKSQFDFDEIEDISPEELHFCVGLTHQQFENLLHEMPSLTERSRHPKTVLGAYLMKMRTGEPDERLAARLNMSRRSLERKLELARECLLGDFVPNHLGWDHITREQIIEKNLAIANHLYGDIGTKAVLIFDGTYIYIQKSGNFLFQKKTYSPHKFRNLIKPYLVVCPDGYIVDVAGPYAATTSDADIMSQELAVDGPMNYVLEAGDVFIVDRGFRNSIPDIEACGYEAHMPPTKQPHETQLSTEDANKSRLVTIVRWVVEVINGRLKRDFKLLRQEYCNRALPKSFNDVRIAAALTNVFKEPLGDSPYANEIIEIIDERREIPNLLGNYVVEQNINRQRAAFQNMTDAEVVERTRFPRLTTDELVLIALGTYQIKLARSYLSEQVRNGVYQIEICETAIPNLRQYGINIEAGVLLRGRIRSRLTGNKIHYSYILVNNGEQGRRAILNHYCSCRSGKRTIGTCAHIISIMWFLGWARYTNVLLPATFLDNIILNVDN
ncbi:uncharacterized protein LOC134669975 [Cydia fagiglandana]|uniref:uncharacterized protein LOC134669975 n=1 Tax=Cydia fagiglandana TaxID=1458189 RepID=UPI002FEE49A7